MKRKVAKKSAEKKSRGKKTSLGIWTGGEFQPSSGRGGLQRTIAQRQFLLVASELYHVTAELRDKVLPLYRTCDDRAAVAMRKWCNQFRLWQPWVRDQLKVTLQFWTLFPKLAQLDQENPPWQPLFDIVVGRPRPEATVSFVFTYQAETFEVTVDGRLEKLVPAGWDLELELKEHFVAEARRQFEAALSTYCAEQELAVQQKGLVRVKRSRAGDYSLLSKIRWTVHRHCGRMPFEKIAADHRMLTNQNVEPSTIGKVVREISQLIELDGNLV